MLLHLPISYSFQFFAIYSTPDLAQILPILAHQHTCVPQCTFFSNIHLLPKDFQRIARLRFHAELFLFLLLISLCCYHRYQNFLIPLYPSLEYRWAIVKNLLFPYQSLLLYRYLLLFEFLFGLTSHHHRIAIRLRFQLNEFPGTLAYLKALL